MARSGYTKWQHLFFLMFLLPTGPARAEDCNCDHVIAPGTGEVRGDDLGVVPGDRICVTAGTYEFIRFKGIRGTADRVVTILNCGGKVRIHNEDRAYALVVEDESAFFRLTGTGDPSLEYGFEISAPDTDPWPGVGLWLLGKSTNYEADHLEIHDTGFAGVSAKTDPICDGSADDGRFVQKDVSLHHLYVHDTGGEGFYVGSTQSDGQTITCDGTEEVHMPHFLEGIHIHHNIVERTGWDGIQVGMARQNCAVYANTIVDVGSAGEQYQQQGLQIGTFSACDVYNNIIMNGPEMGIIVLGAGPSRFYNNLIVNFGTDGIYAHHRDAVPDAGYAFFFNTIVDHTRNGIRLHGENLGKSVAKNNLIVGPSDQLAPGGEIPDFEAANNLTYATRTEAGFAASDDFHLSDTSPARGSGIAIDGIAFDLEGNLRPSPPSVGALEHPDDIIGDAGDISPPDSGPEEHADDAGSRPTDAVNDVHQTSKNAGCGCAQVGFPGHGVFITVFKTLIGC